MKDKLLDYGVLVGEEHQQGRGLLDYGVLVGEEHQQGRGTGLGNLFNVNQNR